MEMYKVGNVTCSSCKNEIETYLNDKLGIKSNVNVVLKKIQIKDLNGHSFEEIKEHIEKLGYTLDK